MRSPVESPVGSKFSAMPFKPPKREALRTFVVLDSEAVLSGLSALDGGAVDEILTRTTEDAGSQLGGQVGGRVAKAHGAKNGAPACSVGEVNAVGVARPSSSDQAAPRWWWVCARRLCCSRRGCAA